MKDIRYQLFHFLRILVKLIRPGGGRSVIAENQLLRRQLIIHSRSRQRAPNLTTADRILLGFFSVFINPHRIARAAIIIEPSTLLFFHNALKKREVPAAVFSRWRQDARSQDPVEKSYPI